MEKPFIVLDFETASAVDLKVAGARVYAEDPTTEVLCLAYRSPTMDRAEVWQPGAPIPLVLARAIEKRWHLVAHNSAFEQAIWEAIMVPLFEWPVVAPELWHDTMAMCAMRALPLKLEAALTVLALPLRKDTVGSRLAREASRPSRKTGRLDRTEQTLSRIAIYCKSDVDAELALHERLGELPGGERQVWELDQKINTRGCKIDLPLVGKMLEVFEKVRRPMEAEFCKLTGGIEVGQAAKIRGWLETQGVLMPDLQKASIAEALGEGALATTLPEHVRRALIIRRKLASASVKKLQRMQQCVCSDGRVRGLQQYHGATTGRWTGRLFQPHNFPTGTLEVDGHKPDPELVVDALMTGDPQYVREVLGDPIEVLTSALRHCIVADEGRRIAAGDFMGIEARILLALSGQHDKAQMMADGKDVYCDMAERIYKRPITKADNPDERKVGKQAVLGLGYGLGAMTFGLRAAPNAEPEFWKLVVDTYRKEWAPKVPRLWYALEEASSATVHTGKPHEAYGVTFFLHDRWLAERLPSGRIIWFADPKPEKVSMPWDATDVRQGWSFKTWKLGQWRVEHAFGGQITGVTVQAIDRDLLVNAMFKVEEAGLNVILNVHDECIAEPEISRADEKLLANIMGDVPKWCRELEIPVGVDAWVGGRYRK